MKISISSLLLCAILAIVFVSCDDDDEAPFAPLTLNFDALFNGEPLRFNTVIDYNGTAMDFRTSTFFISEVTLKTDTSEVVLSRNELVDFANGDTNAEAAVTFDDVPTQEYTGISFFIGVPADLNAMMPMDFDADEALAMESMWWASWESYIFSKHEGFIDTDGDNDPDLSFVYHSGKNDLYFGHELTFASPMRVSGVEGASNTIDLAIDHLALFKQGDSYLDIEAKPTAHGPNDLEYVTVILNNFDDALSLR